MKQQFTTADDGFASTDKKASIKVFGITATVKAASDETGGAYCVIESRLPAHYRLVEPHWHAKKSETFYVIEGALTFTCNDQTFIAQSGSYVVVPPRTVHVYWNSTAAPVTFLTISAPSGLECYLAELAEVFAERAYEPALAAEIAKRYDQFLDANF